ncbi:uncharacterized protein LOC111038560 [Myzus persicae]|uniref:uncharacterized protein LOC111038560 n=1 Tax=Myzus persicae TaxID=13164 RepID=UPI000B93408C|nr:uncharacterized protein LOC111038560 [Myzus persicae]
MSLLKRKATTDLNVKPNKLIRQELRNCPKSESLSHSDVRLFRKSMYEARRKIFPKIPKSLFEAKAMIFQNKKDFVSNNEPFCFMDSESSVPIFTNATNMSLLNSSKHVFADGTFSYAPKYFLQMYTIHVYLNGFYVPIIFVFMDSKTQKSYTDVWLKIKELYFKFQGQQLQLKMIHLDFEKAAHNAVLEVFENCQVVGCRFHLSQAWFRHIKNCKELNKHYTGKTVVYQWLQSFFGLSYLPSNEVNVGFVSLMANAPPNVEHFTDYIVDTFIDENSLFPPHFWAGEPSMDPRTTNGPEAFHRDFNSQFYTCHPNCFAIINILLEVQEESYLKIGSIKRNLQNKKRKEDMANITYVLKKFEEYKVDKDVAKYLSLNGPIFTGKNII